MVQILSYRFPLPWCVYPNRSIRVNEKLALSQALDAGFFMAAHPLLLEGMLGSHLVPNRINRSFTFSAVGVISTTRRYSNRASATRPDPSSALPLL